MLRGPAVRFGRVAMFACVAAWLACASPVSAQTRRRFRARFEPTSLQLEDPGKVELDLQMGGIYGDGQDGSRLVSPDFELDLGILRWLEFDIDGGFTVTHVNASQPTRATYGEPLWTSAKVALYGHQDQPTGRGVGVGLQLGPRLPSLRTAPGVGFAALLIAGAGSRRTNVVVNFGTVLDRGQSPGIVYGIDVDITLGRRAAWALVGELGGGHYFGSSVPNQLMATFGVAYQANDSVGLSLIGLGGFLPGNDRLGVIAGVSTAFGLWGARAVERGEPAVVP